MTLALFFAQLLNGFQLGVLLFLLSAGLTLVLGIMRFINLAHGSLFMVGAYFAVTTYEATQSFVLAGLVAIAGALLLGAALERMLIAKLYSRDHLYQVLATFGLILVFNELARIIWGQTPIFLNVPDVLSGTVNLFGFEYPAYRFAIITVGLLVGVALYIVIHRTRIGMLIRAGASDAEMVAALGVNIRLINTAVFAAAAALAGVAGVMAAPILSVQPGMGEPILILTLVVIVTGGIGSIRGAFYGALIVGVIDTIGRSFLPAILREVFERSVAQAAGPAVSSMLIYLLMAVVLYARPSGLFPAKGRRDNVVSAHALIAPSVVPAWRSFAGLGIPAIIFLAFAAVPMASLAHESYILSLVTRVMIVAIAALALDLLVGYGAMISFGHAAFVGLGAYAAGILSSHGIGEALVALPAALLLAAAFAYLTGLVILRTRGVYFIMITLAFSQMVFFIGTSLAPYGGDDGMTLSARNTVAGFALFAGDTAFYYVVLAFLIASYLLCRSIVGSRFGRVLRGIKENPTRMETLGYRVFRYQLAAYVIAGALAGLSGYLLANVTEFVSPAYMSWQRSGELIIMLVMGGIGSLYGAILGTVVYLLSEEWLSSFTEHWKVIFGPILVLLILFFPRGLGGIITDLTRRLRRD